MATGDRRVGIHFDPRRLSSPLLYDVNGPEAPEPAIFGMVCQSYTP